MSEETLNLLERSRPLSVEEKRVFASEVLHRVLPERFDVSGDKVEVADPLNFLAGPNRAKAFNESASRHSIDAPPLSDEAISRETIYSTRD
jgi:hypothetical protein